MIAGAGCIIKRAHDEGEGTVDWLCERKAEFEKEFAELKQMLIDELDYKHRKFVEDDIRHTEKIPEIIRRSVPV